MKVISLWKQSLRKLQVETYAIYLAYRHPRTPWYAKLLAALVIAYAVSPIDLIPDFIPVIGLLDDLILVPLGTALTLKMIPRDVLAECRQKAVATMELDKQTKARWVAAGIIIAIWCLVLALVAILVFRIFVATGTPTTSLAFPFSAVSAAIGMGHSLETCPRGNGERESRDPRAMSHQLSTTSHEL